jgi:hypothetical protein
VASNTINRLAVDNSDNRVAAAELVLNVATCAAIDENCTAAIVANTEEQDKEAKLDKQAALDREALKLALLNLLTKKELANYKR